MAGNHTRRNSYLKNNVTVNKQKSNTRKNKLKKNGERNPNGYNIDKIEQLMINTFKSKKQLQPLPKFYKTPEYTDEYIRRINEPIFFKKQYIEH